MLGFKPSDVSIYRLAFTHSSASLVSPKGIAMNNERLEFLGDAILDSIVTDFLFNKYPNEKEGFLTTMRSKIVNRNFLDNIGEQLDLNQFLKIQLSENSETKHHFGNAFEALIGAIYIDRGYNKTKNFVIHKLINRFIDIEELQIANHNYKSRVIEFCQKHKLSIQFITEETSDKQFAFESRIYISDEIFGFGFGQNKKDAEQKAAEIALDKLQNKFENL
ncbi:MAG TPA: ribonuclease III [Bacteroidales bacterium]|nr:ribonuclease III [Bacteroidales bacterium]